MSKLSEKLARKIEKEIGIRCNPDTFVRTYAGKWQRLAGAFVWEMVCEGGRIDSISPASDCVRSDVWLDFDPKEGEVFPEKRNV